MKARTRTMAALFALHLVAAGAEPPEPFPAAANANPDAAATLVIYNERDPESADLARFYVEKRGIPKAQMLALRCSLAEEITREEYDRTIAEPVRRAMTANFWWKLRAPGSQLSAVEANKIRFVALMRGVPLKIAPAPNYPGDKPTGDSAIGSRNEAAVDSELAAVGIASPVISGALNNPYFRSFTPIADAGQPEIMLVCRLDGPSAGTVRRMITDGLAAEREGLTGLAYIDARGLPEGGPYREGDDWMLAAANTARRKGMPVILDDGPDIFPESYPMRQAAIYYGWYTDNVAGPFVRPEFRFARGAVAVHIHSFSAATVRDPQKNWVAPLLFSGAAATLGNVYEPYLTLTPHLDVFHDRLTAGFTFAEASFMCQRVLSWMTTSVGDPLYRPFAGVQFGDQKPATGEWAEYRKGAKLWFSDGATAGAAALKTAGTKLRSGVIFEGLGLLELTANHAPAAIADFEQARKDYTDPEDIARTAIHELIQLRAAGRAKDAVALARKLIAVNPRASFVPLLRTFDPAPATPLPLPAITPRPLAPATPK